MFAIIMVVVFLTITLAYPTLFKPGPDAVTPAAEIPLNQPAAPAN